MVRAVQSGAANPYKKSHERMNLLEFAAKAVEKFAESWDINLECSECSFDPKKELLKRKGEGKKENQYVEWMQNQRTLLEMAKKRERERPPPSKPSAASRKLAAKRRMELVFKDKRAIWRKQVVCAALDCVRRGKWYSVRSTFLLLRIPDASCLMSSQTKH